MYNQSSRFIIPFSIFVVLALIGLLVFVFLAEKKGWFDPSKELIESLETEDQLVSYPDMQFSDFTIEEVKKHNTKEDCYVVIDELIYFLTPDFLDSDKNDFFDETYCGQEITEAFKTQVEYIVEDLTNFLIGKVVLVKN
jgi:cytochrome b involved in lipid metabolism